MRSNSLLVVVLAVISISCSLTREVPLEIPLCRVLAEPAAYDGKLITFRASVESDGRHLTLLTDATCSGAGIALLVDDEIIDSEGATTIRKAIAAQRFGVPRKQIQGAFTGILRLHSGEVPTRVLQTRAISDVQVSESGQ